MSDANQLHLAQHWARWRYRTVLKRNRLGVATPGNFFCQLPFGQPPRRVLLRVHHRTPPREQRLQLRRRTRQTLHPGQVELSDMLLQKQTTTL